MLLRRHRKAKELKEEPILGEVKFNDGESTLNLEKLNDESEKDLRLLKNEELKKLLDEKGIEYDSKAKKEDLIKLLEGAE